MIKINHIECVSLFGSNLSGLQQKSNTRSKDSCTVVNYKEIPQKKNITRKLYKSCPYYLKPLCHTNTCCSNYSPFQTRVLPGVDASKVKVTGPGVSGAIPASLPAQFTIDTREAGIADLECVVQVRFT